jgi:hypothetical protein
MENLRYTFGGDSDGITLRRGQSREFTLSRKELEFISELSSILSCQPAPEDEEVEEPLEAVSNAITSTQGA